MLFFKLPCLFRDFASFFGGLPLRPTFLTGTGSELLSDCKDLTLIDLSVNGWAVNVDKFGSFEAVANKWPPVCLSFTAVSELLVLSRSDSEYLNRERERVRGNER